MDLLILTFIQNLGTLLWLGFWGLILYGIWVLVRNSVPAFKGIGPEDLSPFSAVLTFFLMIAVIFLFQQAWSDLGRLAGGGFDRATVDVNILMLRALFVGPATLIALTVYFLVRGKGTRYGVVTLPYFITSLIFLVRLLFDAGRFVLQEYRVWGIYIVLIFIIVTISAIIFFIQKQYEEYKHQEGRVKEALKKESDKSDPRMPKV